MIPPVCLGSPKGLFYLTESKKYPLRAMAGGLFTTPHHLAQRSNGPALDSDTTPTSLQTLINLSIAVMLHLTIPPKHQTQTPSRGAAPKKMSAHWWLKHPFWSVFVKEMGATPHPQDRALISVWNWASNVCRDNPALYRALCICRSI